MHHDVQVFVDSPIDFKQSRFKSGDGGSGERAVKNTLMNISLYIFFNIGDKIRVRNHSHLFTSLCPVALDRLPNFKADPNLASGVPGAHHTSTIHLNCESMDRITASYEPCTRGEIYHRPMIEMCIPSSLDRTIAPEGCHVATLFTQYTPYHLANGEKWDERKMNEYADMGEFYNKCLLGTFDEAFRQASQGRLGVALWFDC